MVRTPKTPKNDNPVGNEASGLVFKRGGRAVSRTKSEDNFDFNGWNDSGFCNAGEIVGPAGAGEDDDGGGFLAGPAKSIKPKTDKVSDNDVDWFSEFEESEAENDPSEEDRSNRRKKKKKSSSKKSRPNQPRDSFDRLPGDVKKDILSVDGVGTPEHEEEEEDLLKDAAKSNRRGGKRPSRVAPITPGSKNRKEKVDIDRSRRSSRSSHHKEDDDHGDENMDQSRRGRRSSHGKPNRERDDNNGRSKTHRSRQDRSGDDSKDSDNSHDSNSDHDGDSGPRKQTSSDGGQDGTRRRGKTENEDEGRRGRRSKSAEESSLHHDGDDDDDCSVMSSASSMSSRARKSLRRASTASPALSSQPLPRRGESRRASISSGECHRDRSRSRSVRRGSALAGARSRSRSTSRRRAGVQGSEPEPAPEKSMLGPSMDSDYEDEDIDSLFNTSQSKERRSILDASRQGPIRAHGALPAEEISEEEMQKKAARRRSSVAMFSPPAAAPKGQPKTGSLDDLFAKKSNKSAAALLGAASVHGYNPANADNFCCGASLPDMNRSSKSGGGDKFASLLGDSLSPGKDVHSTVDSILEARRHHRLDQMAPESRRKVTTANGSSRTTSKHGSSAGSSGGIIMPLAEEKKKNHFARFAGAARKSMSVKI